MPRVIFLSMFSVILQLKNLLPVFVFSHPRCSRIFPRFLKASWCGCTSRLSICALLAQWTLNALPEAACWGAVATERFDEFCTLLVVYKPRPPLISIKLSFLRCFPLVWVIVEEQMVAQEE